MVLIDRLQARVSGITTEAIQLLNALYTRRVVKSRSPLKHLSVVLDDNLQARGSGITVQCISQPLSARCRERWNYLTALLEAFLRGVN
jgi:hypothetical protein